MKIESGIIWDNSNHNNTQNMKSWIQECWRELANVLLTLLCIVFYKSWNLGEIPGDKGN